MDARVAMLLAELEVELLALDVVLLEVVPLALDVVLIELELELNDVLVLVLDVEDDEGEGEGDDELDDLLEVVLAEVLVKELEVDAFVVVDVVQYSGYIEQGRFKPAALLATDPISCVTTTGRVATAGRPRFTISRWSNLLFSSCNCCSTTTYLACAAATAFVTFGVKFGFGLAATRRTAAAIPRSTTVTFVSAAATGAAVATVGRFATVELEDAAGVDLEPEDRAGTAATYCASPRRPAAAMVICICSCLRGDCTGM